MNEEGETMSYGRHLFPYFSHARHHSDYRAPIYLATFLQQMED